jgi:DNA-directed RNA polymerase III subunit RPC4
LQWIGLTRYADRRGGLAPGSIKREGGGSASRSGQSSHPTIKKEGDGHKAGSGGKSSTSDPQYPDEDHSLPRIDIQNINLISSDEDEEPILPTHGQSRGKLAMNSTKGGLKPVRLDRQEHKERTSQVNTAPTIKDMHDDDSKDSDTPMVDEERSTRVGRDARKREFKGTYDDDSVEIKHEPAEPGSIIDQVAPGPAVARAAIENDDDEGDDEAERAIKQKKKLYPRKKPAKFVIQTEEDRREWERHLEDLEVLKEELGGMQQDTTDRGKSKEGDTEAEKPTDKKEGRLYLFQFPPAMPKLINPATLPKGDPGVAAGTNNDVQVTGSRDNNVMDLDKPVKPEEEEIIKKEDDEPQTKTKESLATEEGYVGKLIVRESGRVDLDWGGSRMLVGRGIETSFLSMGVLVDSKGCFDEEGKPTREGVATGMGKIMGKFLVTPDWESMVDDMERAERRERRR